MDEMNEMNDRTNAEEEQRGATGLAPRGTELPEEQGDRHGEETGEEGVTLRYRRRPPRRAVGLALSVLLLLVAVLLAVAAMGRTRGDGGETTGTDTTAGTEPETEAPARDLYFFDPGEIPEGHVGIRPSDLSGEAGSLTNLTELTPDLEALSALYGERAEGEAVFTEPLVLILHTHATEAYSTEGATSWDGTGESVRSEESRTNVIAVGKLLADALNGMGIPTLHSALCHDVTEDGTVSNLGSYARSRETVERYRELYPSIRYVIDLHRDAVLDEDGNLLRAVTEVDGEAVAQVMAVVGSGGETPWERDLALALAFSEVLNGEGHRIARAPTLKGTPLLQEHTELGLTLELGTAGNSLDEAKRAVPFVAKALFEVISRIECAEGT